MSMLPSYSTVPQATYTASGKVKQTVYNVKDYGATGNGTTDDYASITAAIAAAGATGGIVFFPYGTYGIKTYLQPNYDNISLIGQSYGSVIIKDISASGLGFVIRVNGNTNSLARSNMTFENLWLDGNAKTDVTFTLHNLNDSVIRRCKVGNCKPTSNWVMNIDSLDPAHTVKAHNLLIDQCDFYSGGTNQDLVAATRGDKITFRDCIFRDVQAGANSFLSISDGTYGDITVDNCSFDDSGGANVKGVFTSVSGIDMKVVNCDFSNFTNTAIVVGGTDVLIEGNYCSGGGITCRGDFPPTRVKIIGNTVDTSTGSLSSGISLTGDAHTVTDNIISPYNAGIFINASGTNYRVENNYIINANTTGNANAGIRVQGSGHIISGNHIYDDRSPKQTKYGIDLLNATYCSILTNKVRNIDATGIRSSGTSDNNTFIGNDVDNAGASTSANYDLVGTNNIVVSSVTGTDIDHDGMLMLDATYNPGIGLMAYSANTTPGAPLAYIYAADTAFSQRALWVNNKGTDTGVEIDQSGTPVNGFDVGLYINVTHSSTTAGATQILDLSPATTEFLDKNNSGLVTNIDQDVTNKNFTTGSFQLTSTSNVSDGNTYTKSGTTVSISSNIVATSGSITDTAKLMTLTQSNSGASGNVLEIANSGTGASLVIDTTTLVAKGALIGVGTSTPTAAVDAKASTTAAASFRIRSGTAPTSPNSGDMWFDGSHLQFRNGAVTNQLDNQAAIGAQFVTLATDATLTNERVLTGTSNQIIITDNGAGSTVVLSTPQNINTTSSPTFAGLTIAPAIATNITGLSFSGAAGSATGIIGIDTSGVGNAGLTATNLTHIHIGDAAGATTTQIGLDIGALATGGTTNIGLRIAAPTNGPGIQLLDAADVKFGTTTGTKIGTVGGASGQKLAFYGSTPIVQPLLATGAAHTVDDVITALQNLGLVRQT